MKNLENKVIKEKVVKDLTLSITRNETSGRIFVQFTSAYPKLTLQKSFQDNHQGNLEAEAFAKSIKSVSDLRKYFGLKTNSVNDLKKHFENKREK